MATEVSAGLMLSRSSTRPSPRRHVVTRISACLAVAAVLGGTHGAGNGASSPESELPTKVVRVTVEGTAHGSVVSMPRGIDCGRGNTCQAPFLRGTEVTLVAGSKRDSSFVGWTGDCVGSSALCVLVADRTASVKALFKPASGTDIGFEPLSRRWLYVTAPRMGGQIRSSRGISCPGRCKIRLPKGALVTLQAFADRGYAQTVWGSHPPGICRADRCEVKLLDSDVHVAVTFKRAR